MMNSEVLGVDPSLNSTGVAFSGNGRSSAYCIGSNSLRGPQRLVHIRKALEEAIGRYNPSLVAYEGYALGMRGKSNTLFDLGELGGVLKLLILEAGIDMLLVPPTSLKLFATGKGNSPKEDVMAAIQQTYGVSFATSDQYDAFALLTMGQAFLSPRLLPRDRRHYRHKALKGCVLMQGFR